MNSFLQAELDEIENDPDAELDPDVLTDTTVPSIPQTTPPLSRPISGVQRPPFDPGTVKKRQRSPEGPAGGLRGPRLSNSGQSQNESKRPRKNPPSEMGPVPSAYPNTSMSTSALPAEPVAQKRSAFSEKDFRFSNQNHYQSQSSSRAFPLNLLPKFTKAIPSPLVKSNGPTTSDHAIDEEEVDTEVLLRGPIEEGSFFWTPPASPNLENDGDLVQARSSSMQHPKADSQVGEDIAPFGDAEFEPLSSTSCSPPTRSQRRRQSPEADKDHPTKGPQQQAKAQANTASNLQGSQGTGSQGDDLNTATIRSIFKARGIPPLCDDSGDFGPAVEAPDGYEGYSVRFYPEREQPLQIPSGELTQEASTLRWLGISVNDITIVRNYEDAMHLKLPQACRDIIKGTIRANFDPEVHRWLACRVKVLSEFPERSTEKADFINSVVAEFFYRFADLHPSNLFLKDDAMERVYVDKIKSSLRSRASDLKAKQQDPSVSIQKTVAAFIPFLDRLLHSNTPTRPADMFFEEDGVRDLTKPLWHEHWAELKPSLIESEGSEEAANRFRISSYMAWRNWFFFESGFVPKDVRNAYISAAATQDKSQSLTATEIFQKGLPLINNLLYEFSKRTGIPFLLLMTWVDEDHTGQVQTMLQTGRGQASTDISDFRHSGPFVDAELLPRWRSWAGRVFELNDEVSHTMYEHITPDEAAGCPEGTVPKIGGYSGAIDTKRWCKANNRQRVNHDQMQLDINDKVPKSRLPKAIRQKEIERVLANGTTVVEIVDREAQIPYTKFTTMPAEDFFEWLYHFSDPQIPPENQFYFSAELRRAEEAGATMPITVQAALEGAPKPDHRGSNPNQEPAPPKKRIKAVKGSKAKNPSKTKSKQKKESRDQSLDDEDTDEAEEIVLPDSDDLDDLSDADLAVIPTTGSRKSKRIKSKGGSEVQEPRAGDGEADTHDEAPTPVAAPKIHDREELGSGIAQRERHFLSSISIKTPARRLPGVFSLSPAVDPLDALSASRIETSLAEARSDLEYLPLPQFPCSSARTRMSGPRTIYDVLSLMRMLDHIFPQRPQLDHPPLCHKTVVVEPADPALVSAVSQQVWTPLNDHNIAVPQLTSLQRLCTRNPDYANDTFSTAFVWVTEALTVLRQRSFLSTKKEVCTATRIFLTLCRYIVFIGRQHVETHDVQNLVDVAAEWGTVVVTLTYAVHTTRATLLRYPNNEPRSPLTQSTAIPELLSSFLESLYKYISTREYVLSHVPNARWFSVHPNKEIESRIYQFLMNRLEANQAAFHDLAIVGQMELLTVICASHNWEFREMGETDWLSWMRYLNSCILQEPPGDDGQISDTQQSSASALDMVSERQPGSKEMDLILSTRRTISGGPRSQASAPGSSTEESARPPPKDRPDDGGSTASPPPSTAAEKAISEPVKEGASTAAPYRETLGDESGSSLPQTVQAASLELDSAPPLPGITSTGPSFWRPGDKARLIINKKMRDVEFYLQGGTLQMRDSNTHNVLTDRQKKPKKDLPGFDRSLLYHRAEPSSNTSQELAHGVESSSRGSTGKDKVVDSGTRRETRRTAAEKNPEGERQLRSHSERRATDGKGRSAPKGR
ncbi:hypothetical protein FRC01_008002 [Tulasnella sp. 417]|nr:hypothetical protein FRC01_008002 [Tulasnella sp. 417]